jgi:hypothetical protein
VAKFVLVSTKQLLDLVKRFNRGRFGKPGQDQAISKVLSVLPEKLRTSAKNYQETRGRPVPEGKSVVAKDFFEALNTSVSSKRVREGFMRRKKGTTPRWPETHVRRDLETKEWVALDHLGQEMSRRKSAKAAKGDIRELADWLQFSKHPEAVRERGNRYNSSSKDPLTQLINRKLGLGKAENN